MIKLDESVPEGWWAADWGLWFQAPIHIAEGAVAGVGLLVVYDLAAPKDPTGLPGYVETAFEDTRVQVNELVGALPTVIVTPGPGTSTVIAELALFLVDAKGLPSQAALVDDSRFLEVLDAGEVDDIQVAGWTTWIGALEFASTSKVEV